MIHEKKIVENLYTIIDSRSINTIGNNNKFIEKYIINTQNALIYCINRNMNIKNIPPYCITSYMCRLYIINCKLILDTMKNVICQIEWNNELVLIYISHKGSLEYVPLYHKTYAHML